MEVGCPETWGTENAHPKPKQPEHPTALLETRPQATPARKTLYQPPTPSTRHTEMDEQRKSYWVNNE